MFRHKCNTFCIKCMSLEYSIFIITNLSYTLLFSAIAVTSLLCYWYIISNFCQILGTNSLQKSLFEKWGDTVTQYIAALVHHSSLIEQTHEKVVLCNTMFFQKFSIYGNERSNHILSLSSYSIWLRSQYFLSKFIWVLVIYSWFNTYVKLQL